MLNFNLETFVYFLKNQPLDDSIKSYFNDVIYYFDQTFGGCGCSRKARQETAEAFFQNKIKTTDDSILLIIKNYSQIKDTDLLSFVTSDNTVFKQI